MALTVVVRSGDLAAPATITFDAPRIVIGRGDSCEVRLPDPSVSHRHASIRQRGTDYVVIDEGSSNGTFVGPVRLSPHAPHGLRSGDLIRVGRIWLEVRVEQVPVTHGQTLATREIALALVASALSADGQVSGARIRVTKGPDAKRELILTEMDRAYIVGRGAGVDMPIQDDDLSRRHVEVARRGLNLVLRDLGSKNGTLLDGRRLEKNEEIIWPSGSTLVIGGSELIYDDPVRDALAHLETVPDEQMREADPVDPPTGVPDPRAGEENGPESFGAPVMSGRSEARAGIADVPSRAPRSATASGLKLLDLGVALFALVVLCVSLLGLWVLFKT